jgi:hypothetical protein
VSVERQVDAAVAVEVADAEVPAAVVAHERRRDQVGEAAEAVARCECDVPARCIEPAEQEVGVLIAGEVGEQRCPAAECAGAFPGDGAGERSVVERASDEASRAVRIVSPQHEVLGAVAVDFGGRERPAGPVPGRLPGHSGRERTVAVRARGPGPPARGVDGIDQSIDAAVAVVVAQHLGPAAVVGGVVREDRRREGREVVVGGADRRGLGGGAGRAGERQPPDGCEGHLVRPHRASVWLSAGSC